jgi:Tfp pilus assembly protein PilF
MSNIYCGLAKALLKKQQSLDEAEINVEAALVVDENNKLAITLRNEIIAAKN